jgi:hypothetical protein
MSYDCNVLLTRCGNGKEQIQIFYNVLPLLKKVRGDKIERFKINQHTRSEYTIIAWQAGADLATAVLSFHWIDVYVEHGAAVSNRTTCECLVRRSAL